MSVFSELGILGNRNDTVEFSLFLGYISAFAQGPITASIVSDDDGIGKPDGSPIFLE